jgi:60 kDa SS-A/Ro ribonucleoprotein
LYRWIVRGSSIAELEAHPELRLVWAWERAKAAESVGEILELIREHRLPREAVPTRWLSEPEVWEALLPDMAVTALLRNLATLTRLGLLADRERLAAVLRALGDMDRFRRARVHPIAVLSALRTYAAGRAVRGQHTWTPVRPVVDALEGAFYGAFRNVVPTGKRWVLALDVSGSMGYGEVAAVPGLTPRVASAAMALVTRAAESDMVTVGFTAASGGYGGRWGGGDPGMTEIPLGPRERLETVCKRVAGLPMGGTDCALPMLWAAKRKVAADVFVVYTDSETWAGNIHPAQALRQYREQTGISAKLVVVGMVSNGFTIADPNDVGMLDVVGFDTAAPAVIADFAKQSLRAG